MPIEGLDISLETWLLEGGTLPEGSGSGRVRSQDSGHDSTIDAGAMETSLLRAASIARYRRIIWSSVPFMILPASTAAASSAGRSSWSDRVQKVHGGICAIGCGSLEVASTMADAINTSAQESQNLGNPSPRRGGGRNPSGENPIHP
jgi:hypothetical protein